MITYLRKIASFQVVYAGSRLRAIEIERVAVEWGDGKSLRAPCITH